MNNDDYAKFFIDYCEDDKRYRLQWLIKESSGGSYIGEEGFRNRDLVDKDDRDTNECIVAAITASVSKGVSLEEDSVSWLYVDDVLAAYVSVYKALDDYRQKQSKKVVEKEMPEWAKTALSEGWNPPMNWKP